MTTPQTFEFRLSFNADIYQDPANNLRSRIANILERADFGRLVLLFSSDGGNTDQSLSLHNWLRQLPIEVHIHAIGHVGSASFPVFLAGHRRTCAPLARFFLHEYDWGFVARQTLDRMAEAQQRLRSDIDMARKIIENTTKVPQDLLGALDGRAAPVVISPDKAKEFEIVHEICELGQVGQGGMPVAIWT